MARSIFRLFNFIVFQVLKGKSDNLMGILDIGSFETNNKAINNAYETYVLGVGDFDERIFLGEDANAEIGTPAKSTTSDQGTLAERITVKKDLRQSFEVGVIFSFSLIYTLSDMTDFF